MTPQQRRALAARWAARGLGTDPMHAGRDDVDVEELVDRIVETHLPPERRSTP